MKENEINMKIENENIVSTENWLRAHNKWLKEYEGGTGLFELDNDELSRGIPDENGICIVPPLVSEIEEWAFLDCSSLISIKFPDSVITIGCGAFENCDNLTDITIPDSVKNIAFNAFNDTAWFKNKCQENPLVTVNSILINGSRCEGDITIPDSVKSISKCAFLNGINLKSIILPDTVSIIDIRTFCSCIRLKNIVIPESVNRIEYHAFEGCTSLTDISIPESVIYIGSGAFEDCTSLSNVSIPETVKWIESDSFRNTPWYDNLVKVNPLVIINGILLTTSIRKGSVIVPDSVTKIGFGFFDKCTNDSIITIPDTVIYIQNSGLYNDFKILCNPGSYAEIFAFANGIRYEYL